MKHGVTFYNRQYFVLIKLFIIITILWASITIAAELGAVEKAIPTLEKIVKSCNITPPNTKKFECLSKKLPSGVRFSPGIGQVIKFEQKGEHRNGKEKEIHIRIQGKSGTRSS